MVSNIGSNSGASLIGLAGIDVGARIAALEKQMVELQKKMHTLQKKLLHETDPAVRIMLSEQLEQLAKTMVTLQQQIELVETAETRKKSLQQQLDPLGAEAADAKPA